MCLKFFFLKREEIENVLMDFQVSDNILYINKLVIYQVEYFLLFSLRKCWH